MSRCYFLCCIIPYTLVVYMLIWMCPCTIHTNISISHFISSHLNICIIIIVILKYFLSFVTEISPMLLYATSTRVIGGVQLTPAGTLTSPVNTLPMIPQVFKPNSVYYYHSCNQAGMLCHCLYYLKQREVYSNITLQSFFLIVWYVEDNYP